MEKTGEKSNKGRYFEAVGRRKTSVARVRLFPASKDVANFIVNKKNYEVYFPTLELQKIAKSPFEKLKLEKVFAVEAKLKGGGIHSQADALRHGISRAILKVDPEQRKILKKLGYLKRDPRMKERRKFGLKKARKAPQWAKR